MQNRRNFLKMLVGGVAVAAAVPSFPFRVFSFPTEIKPLNILAGDDLIAGWVSYRFYFTTTMPPDVCRRIRYINSDFAEVPGEFLNQHDVYSAAPNNAKPDLWRPSEIRKDSYYTIPRGKDLAMFLNA